MRRVRVFKMEYKPPARPERVADGAAYFHQWGSAFEEFESGPGNYTIAIIERSNGLIEEVTPSMIEFIDPPTP